MSDRSTRYAVSTSQINALTDLSCRIYASAPFKFIVEGESLYIHANLVSLHSKPLDRMINGHMAEAQEGLATLKDVGVDTFVRFIEWAYKGYYTAAEFTTVAHESPPRARSPSRDDAVATAQEDGETTAVAPPDVDWRLSQEMEPDAFPYPVPSSKKVKKGKISFGSVTSTQLLSTDTTQERKEKLKAAFNSRHYTVRQTALPIAPPRPNQIPEEDYTDVFLSHAQLYVFAEEYDIQSLKVLAFEELHATLAIYHLYRKRTGGIVELLRYVYANTREPTKGIEDMRTLMTQYVGSEMDTLIHDRDLKKLMIEDGGALLSDFMKMVGRRIF